MTAVSVIIVNYNAGARLTACVASVLDTSAADEIIVVDNASGDGSLDGLVSAHGSRKEVRIIRNAANLGFARACNIGARKAGGEYLFFLNPDGVVEGGTIPALVSALESRPDAGMAGARLLNPDGTEQAGGRRHMPTPWRAFVRLSGLYRFKDHYPDIFADFLRHQEETPDEPMEVEAVSGACLMVPRRIIDTVGGFDESYFLHVEDLDWCMRIRRQGRKVLFVPAARVFHSKGGCSHRRPVFVEWHKHRGLMLFYRRYYGGPLGGVWMPLIALFVWSHFLLAAVIRLWQRGRRAD
ncbi:MAG: glycosyltransferase family 2 protein [Thermodesulfobacteriota bacterium]